MNESNAAATDKKYYRKIVGSLISVMIRNQPTVVLSISDVDYMALVCAR